MIDKILDFLLVSSADPSKWSLTFKMALVGVIPYIVNAAGIACGLGLVCLGVDDVVLNSLAEALEKIVFLVLSAVSAVGVLIGLFRKLIRSAQGTNRSFDI